MTLQVESSSFFDKDDIVFGQSTDFWIKLYWDLFYADDFIRSRSHVYCLPTNDEEIPQPKSDYTIKQNKAILIPAGKLKAGKLVKEFKEDDSSQMLNRVIQGMDAFSDFNVFLDGEMVSNECFRYRTPFFKWHRRVDGKFYKYMTVVDAYWLFIKPGLEKGMHHINTYIACSMEQTRISLNYNLEIV